MNKRYYIAYGSNLNIEQMRFRCPDARVIGTAILEGWELLFKGSKTGSYLTIEKKPGASLPVAVWEVSESDEASLDHYEGCPDFYYKRSLDLYVKGYRTGKIRKVHSFVYVMHEDRPLGLPSTQYITVCGEGYEDFGFDLSYLSDAYHYTRREMLR